MKIIKQDLRFDGTAPLGNKLTATVTAKEKRKKDVAVTFDCRRRDDAGGEKFRVSHCEFGPKEAKGLTIFFKNASHG